MEDIVLIVGFVILAFVIAQLVVIIVLFSKNRQNIQADVSMRLAEYAQSLEKNETALRDEFGKNREETYKSARDSRKELSSNLKSVSEQLSTIITNFTGLVDNKMKTIQEFMDSGLKSNREELSASLKAFEDKSSEKMEALTKDTREELEKSRDTLEKKLADLMEGNEKKLEEMRETTDSSLKASREELSESLKIFEEKSSVKIDALTKYTKDELEKNRDSVEKKLADITRGNEKKLNEMRETTDSGLKYSREVISTSLKAFEDKFATKIEAMQKGNEKKLDEMRETVDEKLHKTLETRLGESFKVISDRLELVQKNLGEMQTLANEVGSIKNVLSNVKAKGVLGEYQLGAILGQVLTPEQYAQSVETKAGSGEKVEFAVKIPSRDDSNRVIWLPIDAKFPTPDYETLLDAYESGEKEGISKAQEELKAKIEGFAQNIRQKYIAPPNTTEFGIMFLPFEGLYAEVLRIPGLFESIQNTHKVTIAGPTTISAFLNSLQMGFRSLVVEKRTNEIWDLLGAVKTEFGKFAVVLQKTREKLNIAINEIDNADTRTRAIEKKLSNVRTLPEVEAQKLLGDLSDTGDDEADADAESTEIKTETDESVAESVEIKTGTKVDVDVVEPEPESEPEPVASVSAIEVEPEPEPATSVATIAEPELDVNVAMADDLE
ncbi:MAG: DNA recombination protein RmuC [Fibromonadaceae bacterium]|jgi:DNA recombination protein RmuC|nr:DNA recombination protein RmuC [Fibromonadaceae bacterium]